MGNNIRKIKALICWFFPFISFIFCSFSVFLEWHKVHMTPLFIAYNTSSKDKILVLLISSCVFSSL